MKRATMQHLLLTLILLTLLATSGAVAQDEAGETVTVIDQTGSAITLPATIERVITPYSVATYLVYGVGAGDSLVGGAFLGARDPEGVRRMTTIDPRFFELSSYATMSQRELNLELVALLNPDVILTSPRSRWLDAVTELDIPVVLLQGETPEALRESVRLVGTVFGGDALVRAEAWISAYDSAIARIETALAGLPDDERPRVLFTGEDALRVVSGEMLQSEMIALAGGVSVSADLTGSWNDVNFEQIVLWQPDVIINASYGVGVDAFTGAEWALLPAVADGTVMQMPAYVAPWDTPIQESLLGLLWLAGTLHPDLLPFDCPAEVADFYSTFYGVDLSDEEIALVCGA